jgi:hypothetical protein
MGWARKRENRGLFLWGALEMLTGAESKDELCM